MYRFTTLPPVSLLDINIVGQHQYFRIVVSLKYPSNESIDVTFSAKEDIDIEMRSDR